jgi:hypothetical protein
MAHYTGITGAIYAPVGLSDMSSVTFAQIGATDFYVVQTEATRILRSFNYDVVPGDFTPAAGSVVSVNPPVGELEITGAGATTTVTSTGSALWTMAKVAGFHEFALTVDSELIDVTEFGDSWKQFERSVVGMSAVCQRHWQDENMSVSAAAGLRDMDDREFPVEFFINTTAGAVQRYVALMLIEEYAVAGPRAGAVTEATINMRGTGTIYYRNQDN